MHHPTDRIAHTTAFVTPVVEHWLEREIAQWVHTMKDQSDDPSHHERALLSRSYISLLVWVRVRVRIKVLFRVRVSFPLSALEGMGSPQKLFVDSQVKSLFFLQHQEKMLTVMLNQLMKKTLLMMIVM